jgi:hypothetical protein
MLNGRSVYIWELAAVIGNGTVEDVLSKAQACKFSSLWVKIGDGSNPFDNVQGNLKTGFIQLVLKCHIANIKVYGYHVPNCPDVAAVTDEVEFVTKTIEDIGLDGVVIDNEEMAIGKNGTKYYFQGDADAAKAYATQLRKSMSGLNKMILMSSQDIVSLHPAAYADIIGQAIDVNAPQVYYGESKNVASRLTWAMNENAHIQKPFLPVGAAFTSSGGDGGCSSAKQCKDWALDFIGLISKLHNQNPQKYPGYSFWNWQEAPNEVWQMLATTPVFV